MGLSRSAGEGVIRGVWDGGALRRYGRRVLGDIGGGGWFVGMGGEGGVMKGWIVLGDAG